MKITTNKVLLILLAGTILATLVYAFIPKPVPVDLAPVARGPLAVTVEEDGRTRIKDRYVVAAPLAGQLVRIELKAGHPVEAGKTLLAVIEPSDPALLDVRARAQSEARVKSSEAALNQAAPNLHRAQSQHQFASKDEKRVQKLFADGVVSSRELDDAELRARSTAEELKAAEYAVRIAEFELEQAKAALSRTQPESSENSDATRFEIRAPIHGRVLRVLQESAMVVTPGTPLIEVGDPTDLEVEVDLLSTDAVKIAPGAKVFLEHWGGENPLLGRVRLVEPAGFTKISALGVEEQRVWVKIDFTDSPETRQTLGDAYRVEARIVIWEGENVLKVPAGALFRDGDDWAVFIAREGRAHRRGVKIGHNNGLEAEVLEGLDPDHQVILHPSDRVQDGISVVGR